MTSGISTTITAMRRALVSASMTRAPSDVEYRAQRNREVDPRDRLNQRGIGGQAGQDFAGARDLEEARIHAHDAPIDGLAQVRDHALAEPGHQIEA